MNEFRDYDKLYPDLVLKIMEYFSAATEHSKKSVVNFCIQYTKENGISEMIQPDVVFKICNILVNNSRMTCIRYGNGTGADANFISVRPENHPMLQLFFNSLVYGFEYIYNFYKDNQIVIPLICKRENGEETIGTAFRIHGGIVTAKHCITDCVQMSIKGYSKKELDGFDILFHENENIDIAYIHTNRIEDDLVLSYKGNVTDDVLTMGYPKIPIFTDFLTAEKAMISSKTEFRITPTKGSISAYANNYLVKAELMLITAKIRGGNSGGPVINKNGCVVGVACQSCYYKDCGDYDDLGYGIAVPIQYVEEILKGKNKKHMVGKDYFQDYK